LGLLIVCAAAAALAEEHTKWGAAISAPLVAMGLGCGLALFGLLPATASCAAYDVVWGRITPLASALLVVETRDMSRLRTYGGRLLAAFAVGAVTMFVGALVAAVLLRTPHGAAACLLSSWTGGAVNFIATAQVMKVAVVSCRLERQQWTSMHHSTNTGTPNQKQNRQCNCPRL
jgi:uncharacterized membrane protein